MKVSINDFFSKNSANSQITVDLVIFTEEILNGGLYFLCSERACALPMLVMIIEADVLFAKVAPRSCSKE